MNDLRYCVLVEDIERVLDLLDIALEPKVSFIEDLDAMRVEADVERVKAIRAARMELYNKVMGLRVRERYEHERR